MKTQQMKQQKGFTIIELVVVILLLGILTATALPRFMDVTDEAHDAVVNGVVSGLGTGAALFRAEWYASSQPSVVTSWASMHANPSGFPIGITDSRLLNTQDCEDIFTTLLQPAGRPDVDSLTATTGAALVAGNLSGAIVNANDFVAHKGLAGICQFAYVGQFKNANATGANVPVINFNVLTQTVSLGAEL